MQRKLISVFLLLFTLIISTYSYALLNLELTQGMAGSVPIAIVPFASGSEKGQYLSDIISNDLMMSGRFKVFNRNKISEFATNPAEVKFGYFRNMGVDNIVVGSVREMGGQYEVSFKLLDAFKGKEVPSQSVVLTQTFVIPESRLRPLAHHISDLIYQHITGVRGVFSTKLAYILVQRNTAPTRYILEVCDMDGENTRTLLRSTDPIMSPSWSPNGRKLAYVSFEKKHSAIYIQDVATGARQLISEFSGINGAPAWSPDGNKLALVLSKSGSPNIYLLDIATHKLTQITNDFSINTEPAWSPNGKSIIFTSNRSGTPQIYQKNLASGSTERISYDGNYNARASFARDGNHIVMLNRQSSLFNIGVLDLNSGSLRVLTNSGTDSESPSLAPNSSMVLYGTLYNGRSVLGMVATDGSVQLRLPGRNGEVQDPAWSPFLS